MGWDQLFSTRRGDSRAQDEDWALADDGTWFSARTVAVGGVLLPLLLLGFAAWDLWAGFLWILGDSDEETRIIHYTWAHQPGAFAGLVLFKLGLAGGLFGYYAVGNMPRAGWYAPPIVLAFAALAVVGLLLWIVGELA